MNIKPSRIFDKEFGTSLSQRYKFPDNLYEDEVWKIIEDSNKVYGYDRSERVKNLIKKLNYGHFPYMCVEYLDDNVKYKILCGMASCFNYDDIVWFSINGVYAYNNDDVNNELKKYPNINKHIGWVVSPKTLKKIKESCIYGSNL